MVFLTYLRFPLCSFSSLFFISHSCLSSCFAIFSLSSCLFLWTCLLLSFHRPGCRGLWEGESSDLSMDDPDKLHSILTQFNHKSLLFSFFFIQLPHLFYIFCLIKGLTPLISLACCSLTIYEPVWTQYWILEIWALWPYFTRHGN